MSSAIIKKGEATQRLFFRVESGTGASDLTGKTIEAKLATINSGSPQMLAATIITPQVGADLGRGYIDITSANLAALAEPDQVLLVVTIWNADNSRYRSSRGVLSVVL